MPSNVMAAPQTVRSSKDQLTNQFLSIRRASEQLITPLSPEDCTVQSMPNCSPAKWHLAHTSWFFETFILGQAIPNYKPFNPTFRMLFNSYYQTVGEQYARPQRGLLTRPSLEEVLAFRQHVDILMLETLQEIDLSASEYTAVIEVGLQHEQQHQELLLTDIKHLLSFNPLRPAYVETSNEIATDVPALTWFEFKEGLRWIGYDGNGFSFDNEQPRHRVFLESFALASRLVTNQEYIAFIEEGGYQQPDLWLSDGWHAIQSQGWCAPLYWEKHDRTWFSHTLSGFREVSPAEPVCHLSYYEADAFARWSGARLPTEMEWEVAAEQVRVSGNFVESCRYHPAAITDGATGELSQMYGDVWEWTASSYSPYPGFQPLAGSLGEYNGKFMSNQMTLRGGSCATPVSHIRATYRNFFQPDARWQFSGIRLAK